MRTLHFHDTAAYHRWLAFGHIHHKFHGRANIMIHGKHHAVVHKEHHHSSHMHEYRHDGGHHAYKINYNLGRGAGAMVEGSRSSKPYRTGKANVPKKIWRGTEKGIIGGHGGLNIKMPRLF